MTPVIAVLALAARHGRILLVAGLVAGIALPAVAIVFKPWLQEMVAALLFIAALRIGPRQTVGAIHNLPVIVGVALVYQLGLPLAAVAGLAMTGWTGAPLATALVLMLAAASVSGSPNLTILTGHDPAPALRLLIIGTALVPFTVLPVFWMLPELGTVVEVIGAAGRLFAAIAIATAAAFLVRGLLLRDPGPKIIEALDGLSAIAMAIVVVGLMSAVGPAVTRTPLAFLGWLAIAFAANIGLQTLAALCLARTPLRDRAVPFAIIAGNRNIALFLIALPAEVTDPVLLFIGCYQIPMYLTPLLMRRFYNRIEHRAIRA